ncbi:hypothetical protein GMLC_08070 [Geomonas limicola]|uniref:Lipoprotein n=1 Tax=Geomonas limicola TaxID=2740186 RepID=A0A6V8N3V8_9BACT|nr:hypothetical protein [Geomonas limicola]GFO67228.1 hypothetical protein GMLC_08070 [Geomonas limicola]
MFRNLAACTVFALILASIPGCGGDSGTISNSITLPTDTQLNLYCEDAGVYPETCELSDPDNPYRLVSVTEMSKWELSDAAPSAKARYYLWATALAKSPSGENQFYVATALHQLYTEGRSENARLQAIKAYRSLLDNFLTSLTYWKADWLPAAPTYAVPLKDWAGMRMYDPRENGLLSLFPNTISDATVSVNQSRFDGLNYLATWGYAYDPTPDAITNLGTLK